MTDRPKHRANYGGVTGAHGPDCPGCADFNRQVSEQLPPAGDAASAALDLATYDAGLLGDYGGGNVDWWQDYIRAELARAHKVLSRSSRRPLHARGAARRGVGAVGANRGDAACCARGRIYSELELRACTLVHHARRRSTDRHQRGRGVMGVVNEEAYDDSVSIGNGFLRMYSIGDATSSFWSTGEFIAPTAIVSVYRDSTTTRLDVTHNGRMHMRTWQRDFGNRTINRLAREFLADLGASK